MLFILDPHLPTHQSNIGVLSRKVTKLHPPTFQNVGNMPTYLLEVEMSMLTRAQMMGPTLYGV